MNWTVTKPISEQREEDDVCEHVLSGEAKAVKLYREMDSFGPVGGFVYCQACVDEMVAREEEEKVICYDCKESVKAKRSISWTPYDFYAPQGDTPINICYSCCDKATHIQRVERDMEMAEAEADYYG